MYLKLLGKNVVVLGGTGFVGRSVINELSKQGYSITLAVRRLQRHRDFALFPKTKLIEMRDITAENLTRLFKNADIVFNLYADTTAQAENLPVDKFAETAYVIKQTIEASEVKRFMQLSQLGTATADASNNYAYQVGKMASIIKSITTSGVTVAEPGMLIGVGDETTAIISKQLRIQSFVLAIANTKTQVQPLAVQDFAKAFVNSVTDEETVDKQLIFAGDERLTIKELAMLIRKMMEKKPAFIYSMCNLGANINAKLGRLSLLKSISETFVISLKQDLITEQSFEKNYGFKPVSLEQALVAYVVDPTLRNRYHFYRKEASRNAEDLLT